MKKKLKLEEVKIQSFVTELKSNEQEVMKGGIQTIDLMGCTRLSCGIRACTEHIINCFG